MNNKYSVYNGKFVCHKCKKEAEKARLWKDTLDLTWQCECRYVSKVSLSVKGY